MNDAKEAEILEEIEKISKDVKSIMKKVDALYPRNRDEGKEPPAENEEAPEADESSS